MKAEKRKMYGVKDLQTPLFMLVIGLPPTFIGGKKC